jgi:ABC-type nickel/cobalt efflux system permease component RcnA
LGISGGLVPCPSALVVLLSAVALGRVGFGLLLVFAFSLGLAGVLTGLGLLLVSAKRLFERVPTQMRLVRILPALSALFVALLGLGITTQALVEIGLVRL